MVNKAEKTSQVTDETLKQLKTDVEFKNLVEKIFDLIANKYSTDDIIKLIDDPIKNSYDIQKLAKNIHELLEQQTSKGNIVNIVIESNKKNEEYS
ncbi:MAG: hypothetical protein JXA94_05270, partial [Parachlamydiales bacterium]|nr:hypothetical protein [Parachlamydiales bacterium]